MSNNDLIKEALGILSSGELKKEAQEDAEKFSDFGTKAFDLLQSQMSDAFRAYDRAMTQLQALGRRPNDDLAKALSSVLEDNDVISVDLDNIEIAFEAVSNMLRTNPGDFEVAFKVPVKVLMGRSGRELETSRSIFVNFRKDGSLNAVRVN